MPLFSLDIEKRLNGEYWTNRYILDRTDLGAATNSGGDILAAERTIHASFVEFTKFRVSDTVVNTDVYQVIQVNAFGQRTQSQEYLPLFNVVRVDFNVAGGGRPSRKYLRLPIDELEQSKGILEPTYVAYIQANYADVIAGYTSYVDVDGQVIDSGRVSVNVGMRQLRRGSKRRLLPIIPV
jgi:hypothetical protein